MTHKELSRLVGIEQAIKNIKKVLSEMEKDHWIEFRYPSDGVPLPFCIRNDFKEFLEKKLAELEAEFERS